MRVFLDLMKIPASMDLQVKLGWNTIIKFYNMYYTK